MHAGSCSSERSCAASALRPSFPTDKQRQGLTAAEPAPQARLGPWAKGGPGSAERGEVAVREGGRAPKSVMVKIREELGLLHWRYSFLYPVMGKGVGLGRRPILG
ncbi:hypothetical protein AV530_017718 [Patagioenas fasciata monilis]|uniref:Uncharacterized protein n=1 Tax=Patagioenas fasciata monilis TaxID=372326 RepID=A0A1V4KWQ3_PATFA|nr:hypothetical protein AV530_017718 [Patagioenas fasciata monilis]